VGAVHSIIRDSFAMSETSAFALKADIHTKLRHVSKVPTADFDDAVIASG
jgi:hypothetical protein